MAKPKPITGDMVGVTDRWMEARYRDREVSDLKARMPNRFVVRTSVHGTRSTETFRFDRLKDARRRRDELRSSRGASDAPVSDRSRHSVSELWERYSGSRKAEGRWKPTTEARETQQLHAYILPQFEHTPVRSIKRHLLDEWARTMPAKNGKGLAGTSTRFQVVVQMEAMLRYAAKTGWIDGAVQVSDDVKATIKRQRDKGKRDGIALDLTQAGFLVAAAGHYAPLLMFLMVTGLRIGEARELRVKDIRFKAHLVRVDRNAVDVRGQGVEVGTPKTGKRVTVLTEQALEALKAVGVFDGCKVDKDRLVFRSPTGQRVNPNNLRRYSKSILEAASAAAEEANHYMPDGGVKLHDMRRTFRTWLVDAGVQREVSDWLMGHSEGHVRETYQSFGDATAKEAGQRLSLHVGDAVQLPTTTQLPHKSGTSQ